MKVLLINGSPHKEGTTAAALREVEKELTAAGIETLWFQLGTEMIRGCIDCGGCAEADFCAFADGGVNRALELMSQSDGLVVGSPVHYAAASGSLSCLLDRMFFAGNSEWFAYKPGAAVVVCRRGGATAAFEQLNKYFTISNMPVVSSQYWNMAHGNDAAEAKRDLEGMQIMRTLGKNMAWLLRCIEAGAAAGALPPARERGVATNFIR